MKNLFFFVIMFFVSNQGFTQFGLDEIRIFNNSNQLARVNFYPVSMIFNADTTSENEGFKGLYSLVSATRPQNPPTINWDYNNGTSYLVNNNFVNRYFDLDPTETVGFNIDAPRSPGLATSLGSFGRGVYKVEIRYPNAVIPNRGKIDSVLIEYDHFENQPGDLGIYIDSFHVGRRFTYKFCCSGSSSTHNIDTLPGNKINIWESELNLRRKGYGNYTLRDSPNPIYNQYSIIPQDSRIFAGVYSPFITVDQNHIFPYPIYVEEVGDVFLYDDRQGNLTLNLTIQKSVHSPTSLFTTTFPGVTGTYVSNPSNIMIFDSVFLAIDKGTSSPVVLTLDKFLSPSGINDGTDIIVKNAAKLILKHSDEYSTHAELKVRTYCNVLVQPYGTLKIEKYGHVVLEAGGTMKLDKHSIVDAEAPAMIILNDGGTLINCGANFINKSVCKVANNGGSYTIGGTACPEKVIQNINDSSFIVLDGGNLIIGDSSKLIFDGPTSYLSIKSGSTVKLGSGASIVFKNGAYLRANGATFSQTSSGKISDGLVFENSGLDSIVNCTFSDARTSITIKNDSESSADSNNNIITGNTFYVSQANGRAIDARNVFNLLLYNNTIGVAGGGNSFGMYFRNTIDENSQSLNIVKNVFAGAAIPLYLSCLAANKTQFYVANNEFYGSNSYSLVCHKISGDIKNNVFSIYNEGSAIGLWNCNANIFGNTIYSTSLNMYLNYSYPVISPTRDEYNNVIWTGGSNDFYADENENILMTNSFPSLNMGKNRFTMNTNEPYHVFGSLPDTNLYSMMYNCWINPYDSAKYYLYKGGTGSVLQEVSAVYLPVACGQEILFTEATPVILINKGNGIYDTVFVTEYNFGGQMEDEEALLVEARSDFRRHYYADAIGKYKGIIDNFSTGVAIYSAISEIYDCYTELDTSENQSTTNILFGDLKQYLEEKINSEDYDTWFNESAYDLVLMCETKMEDFEAALTGYEFLALYHPDAEQRMLASWDYEDINELLGEGEGSGSISNYELRITNKEKESSYEFQVTNEERERAEAIFELRKFKQLNEKINDDPILKRMKKRYEKTMSANKQRQEKAADSKNVLSDKLNGYEKQVQSEKLISRAKDNIMRSRYLSKEEKEVSRLEDMEVLFGKIKGEQLQTDDIANTQPMTYSLSQNYPNPFNPVTTISYQLPKAGLVNIIVYDITGKEVAKLVNEFKEAGSYDITFTASNLSSGIYFYSLRADGFTDTKKMVVIK